MLTRIVSTIIYSIVLLPVLLTGFIGPNKSNAETGNIKKIWSAVPHLTWVSKKTISPDELAVTVNGNEWETKELEINTHNGTVHVRIPLAYGESNLIIIAEGTTVLFHADVFYAPSFEGSLVPEEYVTYLFHNEKNERPCQSCHRMKVEMGDIMPVSPAGSMCYPCHNREFEGFQTQHREAGVSWECLRCHQAEPMETDFSMDGPVKFALKDGARVAPLCYRCHINKEKEHTEFTYLHGPVAMKGCNMCHNPHGSNNKRLLQKDISTLCIECHRLQEMMEKEKKHAPLVEKGCTICHDPHGSNSPFFLPADIIETCFSCHPGIRDKGKNHPITGHPVSGPQDPLIEDRPFTCVSCHSPHSSEHNKLLPEDEIMMMCVLCHPRFS